MVQVRSLDGGLAGYVRADTLAPADSTPAKVYDYDLPGSLIGPNGDYVFDTFRVVVRASEPLDGTVSIRNAAGAEVKTLTATDAWAVFDWDLRAGGGTVIPDGHYSWSYRGTEPWGNNAGPFTRSGTFDLDATAPITTATATGTLHSSGWYTATATVRLAGRDAFSGMRATWYQLDGGRKTRYGGPIAIATSGDHQLAYWSVDTAGNVEPTRTLEVKVDVSPPVTTPVLTGPMGEAGFYRDDVTVGLNPVDAQSGVASSEIAIDGGPLGPYTGPVTVSAAGAHLLTFRSTDRTGRREATRTATFTIDRTAPTFGPADSVAAAAAQFSPNGDGLADTIGISHALTERGAIRLVVTRAGGGPTVRSATIPVAQPGAGSIAWDGRADSGGYVPDGDYTLTLTPFDRARNAGPPRSVEVSVFGAFVGLSPAPVRFYPQDGDAFAPRTAAGFTLKAAADVTLRVVNAAGTTVRTVTGTYPAGPVAIAWDGRTGTGAYAPQGRYRLVVAAGVGGHAETHTTWVQAAAFEIKPSATTVRRGRKLTLTVVTSEPLKGSPRLTVHQPGRVAYSVKLIRIGPATYRARWTLKPGGRAGKLTLTVTGTDRSRGRNATALVLRLR